MNDYTICKVIVAVVSVIVCILSISALWKSKSSFKLTNKIFICLATTILIIVTAYFGIKFIEITAYILPLIVFLIVLWINRFSKQFKTNYIVAKTMYSTLISVTIAITVICLIVSTAFSALLMISNITSPQKNPLNLSDMPIDIENIKSEMEMSKVDYYSYQGRDTLDITLKEQPTVENITDLIDTIVTELENSYEITKKSSQKGSNRLLKVILRYNGQEYFSGQFFRNFKSSDGNLVFDRIYLNDVNINKLEVDISQYE